MTTPTNIITFPGHPRLQPQTADTSGANYIAGLTSNPAAIEFAVGALKDHDEDRALHVAAVVGASIRFARRRGISMSSLPTQLRRWLLQECERGDASAIMVREWLTGNARFIDPPEPVGEDA